MTATLVDDQLTPLPVADMLDALADGYAMVMGSDADAKCLAVLGAQVCLETGNMAHVHCHNWGNVKRSADWDGLYCMFRCNEIIGGKVLWFDPPHPQTHFRAYAEASEGAKEYVKFLATRDRYRASWSRAYAGDADGFVRALGKAGYFTANVDSYAKAVFSIAKRLAPVASRVAANAAGDLDDTERAHIGELVTLTLSESARGMYEHHGERLVA